MTHAGTLAATAQLYVNRQPQGGTITIAATPKGTPSLPATVQLTLPSGVSPIGLEATGGTVAVNAIEVTNQAGDDRCARLSLHRAGSSATLSGAPPWPAVDMDYVSIEDLRVDAVIGVHAWEREHPQVLRIDAKLGYDNRGVATLADAIDYAEVAAALRSHVTQRSDALLETLAESCCALLAQRFHPRSIDLRIGKPLAAAALGCGSVGVELHRHDA